MKMTTKVVAWVGAILGASSFVIVATLIAVIIYSGNHSAEQQRQQENATAVWKQGLAKDLKQLSETEIKPMSGDEFRELNSSPTPEKK
jgi:sensor domain CHASE-containing protein